MGQHNTIDREKRGVVISTYVASDIRDVTSAAASEVESVGVGDKRARAQAHHAAAARRHSALRRERHLGSDMGQPGECDNRDQLCAKARRQARHSERAALEPM